MDWVAGLQRGEDIERNSRMIFYEYYGWVRGFFTKRGHAIEHAEELAQDVFFQAFSKIGGFRAESSFESWLFAICANRWRNEVRRHSRLKRQAPEVSLDGIDPESGHQVQLRAPDPSPEERSERREQLATLARAVAELPTKPRECFELRLAGHDFREIAEILRIAPSTARVHVFSARRRLRETLGSAFGLADEEALGASSLGVTK